MDDKVRDDVDEEETPGSAQESGALGRLLEHQIGSSTAESGAPTQTLSRPSEPSTVSTDYAEGTHEHDDDRDG